MSKMMKVASTLALAATASTALAWHDGSNCVPMPTAEQQKAFAEQQQAMMDQQRKAMEQAFAARKQFADEQIARMKEMQAAYPSTPDFASRPFPSAPEMPAMPEFGAYPSMPEMPAFPEMGQYPAMPEMPAAMQDRMKEMDSYRDAAKKRMDERRQALKTSSEQRRAMRTSHGFGAPVYGLGRCMEAPAVSAAPAPQQQAAAPATAPTVTQ